MSREVLHHRRRRRRLLLATLLAVALALSIGSYAGQVLTRSRTQPVGPPPPELAARALRLRVAPEVELAAWFAPGTPGRGAVLLLHGLGGTRRDMLSRARWLRAQGCAVLLCDLRGHGESSATRVSLGLHERADALVALRELRRRAPGERVAAIGRSLGGAALLFAAEELDLDALVLESVYAALDDATADRLELHLGAWARPLAGALLLQSCWWLGASAEEIRPALHAERLRSPTLVLVGDRDRHAPERASRSIAAAAPPGIARLHVVRGAGHGDLQAQDPAGYEAVVGAFLAESLGSPAFEADRERERESAR
jgi:pimeloyl-ACP methyl ester carboxylesterase